MKELPDARQDSDDEPPDIPSPQAWRSLHRYLTRRLGNPDDAQDLRQEVYLRYLRIPDRERLENPDGYLLTIAANLASLFQRRRSRHPVTFDSTLSEAMSATCADERPPVSHTLETRERLQRILQAIPLTYRAVLLMHKRDGLSVREIAERRKLSPETVSKYLSRATDYACKARAALEKHSGRK